jgi:hypothetical protein
VIISLLAAQALAADQMVYLSSHQHAAAMQYPPAINEQIEITKIVQA